MCSMIVFAPTTNRTGNSRSIGQRSQPGVTIAWLKQEKIFKLEIGRSPIGDAAGVSPEIGINYTAAI